MSVTYSAYASLFLECTKKIQDTALSPNCYFLWNQKEMSVQLIVQKNVPSLSFLLMNNRVVNNIDI